MTDEPQSPDTPSVPFFDPPLPDEERQMSKYERDTWQKMLDIENLMKGIAATVHGVPGRLDRLETQSRDNGQSQIEMRNAADAAARRLGALEVRGGAMEDRFAKVESRLAGVESGLSKVEDAVRDGSRKVEDCTNATALLTQTCAGLQAMTQTLYDRVFPLKETTRLPDEQLRGEVVELRPQPE